MIAPSRLLPWLVCALAAGTIFVSARGYVGRGTPYGDDNSSHLAVVRSVAEDLSAGRTDFYFPGNNLGVPLFLSYPPLAHVGVASGAALLGGAEWANALFKLSIVLGWVLMAPAWFVGGRWLGLDSRQAAAFGLVSLGLVDQSARGLSMASALHTGLYSQTFGMLLLPATLGAFYRWLSATGDREGRTWAARAIVTLWLTCLFHAFTGMVAIVASATLVLCPLEGVSLARRVQRATLVFGATFLLLGFWLWPLLAHRGLVGGIPWKGQTHQGSPMAIAAKALLGGDVFDAKRLPWMTLLFLVGLVRAARGPRADVERWALAGLGVFFLLTLGPTSFGPLFRRLPLQSEMNVTRYLSGIHLFGALLVAVSAIRVLEALAAVLRRPLGARGPAVAMLVVTALVAAYLADLHAFGRRAFRTFDVDAPPFAALVRHLAAEPGTRIAVDSTLGTTSHFYRDLLPTLAGRPQIQSYGMTYHATLATYYTEYFDFSPWACGLYDVGAIVGRDDRAPATVTAYAKTFDDRRHQVYACPGERGELAFVELPLSIEGAPKAIRKAVLQTLPLFQRGALARILPFGSDRSLRADEHFVVDASGEVPEGLADAVERLSGEPGSLAARARLLAVRAEKIRVEADVEVDGEPAWLMLKRNAFPYWRATIDDAEVAVATVAPNHQAVYVPAGRHLVRFEYRVPAVWKALAVFSLLAVLGLAPLCLSTVRRRGG